MKHDCNAYCIDDTHCCLVYSDPQWCEDDITLMLQQRRTIKVLTCEPAREAPSITDVLDKYQDIDSAQFASINTNATKAWLVRWNEL